MNTQEAKGPQSTTGPLPVAAVPKNPLSWHKVSAIYATDDEARVVCKHLIDAGVSPDDVSLLNELPLPPFADDDDELLKDMLVDGSIGTAIGAGVGAIGTAMLWAGGVTLFVASPVVAPLAMLGWFASVGGIAGALTGAAGNPTRRDQPGKFSELVMDAIQSGNVALVVRTHDEASRSLAKDIISKSLKGHTETVTESR